MRFVLLIPLVLIPLAVGCFDHHLVDGAPAVDAGRADARVDTTVDGGICSCASDLDCPASEGCVEYVCADCMCEPRMIPRCGECMCASDSDCPTPPPFGDCIRTQCTDCICAFVADDAFCEADAFCDPETLLCTAGIAIRVILRTDLQPFDEFDRITITTARESFEYRPAPGEPFDMGVGIGTVHGRTGEELAVSLRLWLDDVLLEERNSLLLVEPGAIVTFIVTR